MKTKNLIFCICIILSYAYMMYDFFIYKTIAVKAICFAGMALIALCVGLTSVSEKYNLIPPFANKIVNFILGAENRGFDLRRPFRHVIIAAVILVALFFVDSIYATMAQIILFDFLLYVVGVVIGMCLLFISGLPG